MKEEKLFLRTLRGEKVEHVPVWMMRQAGRYLPEYQKLRSQHSFGQMYKTPELAAEVTLQPLRRFEVDAAILFSDILVIPEACGLPLQFLEEQGPVFSRTIETMADVKNCQEAFHSDKLSFVYDTLKILSRELPKQKTLIGFAGAPWTVATYMLEGKTSKKFHKCKVMRYTQGELLHALLELISNATVSYLQRQIDSGAQVVQLFDTWAGVLDEQGFDEFALRYAQKIIQKLNGQVPVIYFAKSGGIWLQQIAQSKCDVIGLDWTLSLKTARNILGERAVFQGNLDPAALYADDATLKKMISQIITDNGQNSRHIMNLGHGIFPDVAVDKAKLFVDFSHEESARIYQEY